MDTHPLIQPGHTLTFYPPLSVVNLLPYDLRLLLSGREMGKIIRKGEKLSHYDVSGPAHTLTASWYTCSLRWPSVANFETHNVDERLILALPSFFSYLFSSPSSPPFSLLLPSPSSPLHFHLFLPSLFPSPSSLFPPLPVRAGYIQ